MANIINYSYTLFGQTFDLLSVLVGMGLLIILFYIFKLLRKMFFKPKKPKFPEQMIKQIEDADKFLRAIHTIQNEQYKFFKDLDERVKGG